MSSPENGPPGRRGRPGDLLLAIWGLGLVVLLFATWVFIASRSLDRGDEGLYLNAINDPGRDPASILLFGYAYHPLFDIVNQSVFGLRCLGMAATIAAGSILAWVVLGERTVTGPTVPRTKRAFLSMVVGATTLIIQVGQPVTPSYHSLALQGLLVTLTGVLLARCRVGRWRYFGWVLLGLGGALCGMGKPTTALALIATLLCIALYDRGAWLRGIPVAVLACGATVLLLLGSNVFDLPATLRNGLRASILLGGHADLIRLDSFGLRAYLVSQIIPSTCLLLVVGVAAAFLATGRPKYVIWGAITLFAGVPLGGTWVYSSWRAAGAHQFDVNVAAHMMVIFAAVSALLSVTRSARKRIDDLSQSDGHTCADIRNFRWFPLILAIAPMIFAFGTNGNLWTAIGRASVCWILLSTLYLLRMESQSGTSTGDAGGFRLPAAVPALSALALIASFTVMHMTSPFRYPSTWASNIAGPVSRSGSTLGLTAEDAAVTRHNLDAAHEVGLAPGDFVLDLSGDSPGYQFQLGVRPVGQDWILGGYPGSEATARFVIGLDRCAVREAWVLTAPGTPRNIDPRVLDAVGLDLRRDFEKVATLFRYSPDLNNTRQPLDLWKPLPGRRIAGCADGSKSAS